MPSQSQWRSLKVPSRVVLEFAEASSGGIRLSASFQAHLGFQVLDIPKDRGDGERASRASDAHQAVFGGDIAFDGEFVPSFGMADIVDRNIVVLAPEERNGVESFMSP